MISEGHKDLCQSCQRVFECMGQGVFGTEECSEWEPDHAFKMNSNQQSDRKDVAGIGRSSERSDVSGRPD